MDEIVQFDFPTDSPKIIKVIGVGGGGGNAVNHMYREGIHDVTFVLCNTDNEALAESPVPVKLQLGRSITQGLGAGNRPERARDAAEESIEDIKTLLNDGTKMVFITAGMGGGTGTGVAPVIARIAKEMDILTVGIVTIPFIFEGEKKIIQALDGVERIAQHVDALLVINNERLREIYSDLTFMNAFGKADDTLSIAAKEHSRNYHHARYGQPGLCRCENDSQGRRCSHHEYRIRRRRKPCDQSNRRCTAFTSAQ